MVNVKPQLKNLEKLQKDLDGIRAGGEKAIRNTLKDMGARAPGWIASEVTSVYNIKKSEITPQSRTASKPQKKAAGVAVRGETIDELTITYTGRLLTPTHFGMTPRSRPKATGTKQRPKPYTVSAEIKKGGRKVLGSGVFLGGNRGEGEIPFQRRGDARLPVDAVKTLSVPQMITNDQVAEGIEARMREGLRERLQHNVDRALGR